MSYHDEQESLESVKAWWAKWGNTTTWIVLVALIIGAGYNGWNFWQRRQAAEASVLYDHLQQAVNANDQALVTRVATDMEDKFGGTGYAQMSALARYRTERPYAGRVLMLMCSDADFPMRDEAAARWRSLASDLTAGRLAADHFGVFDPEHLPQLTGEIAAFLGLPAGVAR